ncbi:MAG: helix-turn-helix transcriptional regulator [Gemmatimonadota bacterium]|nr:helix-turn-helix transcriptional regulator [Gemmatimonadota bacterium]
MDANLSLRDVADRVGVSHVFLGEVERGIRTRVAEERWPALSEAIPGVSLEELRNHVDLDALSGALSGPIQLNLADAPPQYQDLAHALARTMREQKLSDVKVKQVLRMLREDPE